MRSQKIRLKLTKEQEEKAWRYAYVSRHFWNLLVEMDRKNNLGEYDDLLLKRGNTTYYSRQNITRLQTTISKALARGFQPNRQNITRLQTTILSPFYRHLVGAKVEYYQIANNNDDTEKAWKDEKKVEYYQIANNNANCTYQI